MQGTWFPWLHSNKQGTVKQTITGLDSVLSEQIEEEIVVPWLHLSHGFPQM